MLGAIGLVLDLIGVILLGFVLPRRSVAIIGERSATRARGKLGHISEYAGWVFLLIGFSFQLAGQLRALRYQNAGRTLDLPKPAVTPVAPPQMILPPPTAAPIPKRGAPLPQRPR